MLLLATLVIDIGGTPTSDIIYIVDNFAIDVVDTYAKPKCIASVTYEQATHVKAMTARPILCCECVCEFSTTFEKVLMGYHWRREADSRKNLKLNSRDVVPLKAEICSMTTNSCSKALSAAGEK